MTAQKILNLIENVDPNDRAAIWDINARFDCWYNKRGEYCSLSIWGDYYRYTRPEINRRSVKLHIGF